MATMGRQARSVVIVLVAATFSWACGDGTPSPEPMTLAAEPAPPQPKADGEAAKRAPERRPAQVRMHEPQGNQRPVIRGLFVQPAEDAPALWQAMVEADDAEGDPVELEYTWFVNGVRTDSHGERFDPTTYQRGDRFHVEVTPRDRHGRGAMAGTSPIEIQNSAPDITSQPPARMAGGVYRYVVEAKDPEGDRPLRYELLQCPSGMHIDPYSGELEWRPDADQVGTHTIEIAVSDNRGGRSTQLFDLPITSPGA